MKTFLILSINLKLQNQSVLMNSYLRSSVWIRQHFIIFSNHCRVRNTDWMGIPGISIFNHEFLRKKIHQRMRQKMFLNHTFNIGKFREEKARLQVILRLIRSCFFHKVSRYRSSYGHRSRIMETYISDWFPFLSLVIERIIITCQVIKKNWVCPIAIVSLH